MSQQGLETVNYWNEIAAVSRNTAKLLKINWTIENMSTVNGTITGPEFYLEINCLCSILFNSGGNSDYYVFLVNKSDLNIKMQSHIIFLDSDGGVLHEQTMGTEFDVCKNSREKISTFSYSKSRLTSLKNDKLIIHCVIKVKGRNTTKINFLKSASESWKNLIDDWKKMFKNPVSSDFTLQVGDKIIRAHKTVLLARSAYFRRMFETEMREQAESTVHVTDVLYPTLQKLIEFLYTGSFSDTEDGNIQEIFDLYIAADKYNVVELRAVCGERQLSAATVDNILQILQLAQSHGDGKLKMRAMDFVFFKYEAIEKSSEWKTFVASETVLASEILNSCFEHFKYSST